MSDENKKLNEEELEQVSGGFNNYFDDSDKKGYWYKLCYSVKWRTVDEKDGFGTAGERDAALEEAKENAIKAGGRNLSWTVGYNG